MRESATEESRFTEIEWLLVTSNLRSGWQTSPKPSPEDSASVLIIKSLLNLAS